MKGCGIMRYEDFIQNILDTRGRFGCSDNYHERHHIVPKCMGGNNNDDNLIDLYAREHFIAHKLLAQENPENNALIYAYGCMAWASNVNQERHEVSAEEYEQARIALSNAMKGKPKTTECRAKLSASKKGKPLSKETKEKLSIALKGRTITEETKEKISKALKGKVRSEEHCLNISNAKQDKPLSEKQKAALKSMSQQNKGRRHSEESKRKISSGNKGKCYTAETKQKMSESAKNHKPNRSKKLLQCHLASGEVIREWESAAEAHRVTGIDNSSILKCARGIKKYAGGFAWKFVEY